jgi:tripartite-type tricarboxylate transporter receptor subunit TctC
MIGSKAMARFSGLCALLVALVLLPLHSRALAQDYPTRPIRVIATSSAGGTSDIFMRALADELNKRLGQPVIVENRPGGAFNIGARACAEAAPDGYTLCIIPGEPLVFNQFLESSPAGIARPSAFGLEVDHKDKLEQCCRALHFTAAPIAPAIQ